MIDRDEQEIDKSYLNQVPADSKILLIEDSGIQAKSIVKLLKDMGYEQVSYCATPEEAVDRIKSAKPTLILCDWEMPKKSGIEILKEMRLDQSISNIPFIFLTAHSSKETVIEAIKNGANDYIIKPPNAKTIAEKFVKVKLNK